MVHWQHGEKGTSRVSLNKRSAPCFQIFLHDDMPCIRNSIFHFFFNGSTTGKWKQNLEHNISQSCMHKVTYGLCNQATVRKWLLWCQCRAVIVFPAPWKPKINLEYRFEYSNQVWAKLSKFFQYLHGLTPKNMQMSRSTDLNWCECRKVDICSVNFYFTTMIPSLIRPHRKMCISTVFAALSIY